MTGSFKVARNPDPESRLPYLVRLPIEGGIVLKAREPWPRASRVYCSHEGTPWDEGAGLLDEADEVVAGAGGRIYLAKDARMRPELLARMYPRLDEWRATQTGLDPHGVMHCDLARRVRLVAQ